MCCLRYGGNACATAATSASSESSDVTATYAPIITIDAVITLPTSTASSVAGIATVTAPSAAGIASNTVEFTNSRPPGATRCTTGAACSGCITIADPADDTVGGASIGPSANTSVASVLPPRIMPP